MATFFLILIYIAFISLGLPDTVLGAAWPVMRIDLGASLKAAGLLSMVVSAGTIVSSLASDRVVRRFGAGKVTAVSVLATALALLGFGVAPSYAWLIVMAIPLGLGAGAVDAALNNYVALHYEARHMSWLHCFWGVGAFSGPMILAACMQRNLGWRGGYFAIGVVQLLVAVLLLLALPLWKKNGKETAHRAQAEAQGRDPDARDGSAFRIPGVIYALLTFLFYCAAEHSAGLWGSSYLVDIRNFSETQAAHGSAMFYAGITAGRFMNGFLTMKCSGPRLIRGGLIVIMASALSLAMPLSAPFALAALLFAGLGCAPIYPCMIHETPRRFGAVHSQKVIGLQMASAYCGVTLMPPLLGVVASRVGLWIFPFALLAFALIMLACSEHIETTVWKAKGFTS